MSDDTYKLPSAAEITEDVSFTEVTMDDNMIRQPSLVAHYARLVGEVQFAMDTAKQVLEITESIEAQKMRDEAAEAAVKITETQISSSLPTIENVMKARKRYNRAKADFEAAKGVLEALRHKKDMMIQLAVGRRMEIENKIRGLTVAGKVEEAGDKDRAARAEAKARADAMAQKAAAA
ncbi:MAG: hypothetical protein LPK02_07420 [Rhodobacterales bacterium]|nr:hypothetical protein [Rhodobacterales bacterium]